MSDKREYPVTLSVSYTNDKEYRQCIREIFAMVSMAGNVPNPHSLDEVTLDENDFDQETTRLFLEYVYEKTIHNRDLKELYKTAAALMICEDPSIGLAVLFSYDYFTMFHRVLCDFFSGTVLVNQENEHVKSLQKKMSR